MSWTNRKARAQLAAMQDVYPRTAAMARIMNRLALSAKRKGSPYGIGEKEGPGVYRPSSKRINPLGKGAYVPHQGPLEMKRRRIQMLRAEMKSDGLPGSVLAAIGAF